MKISICCLGLQKSIESSSNQASAGQTSPIHEDSTSQLMFLVPDATAHSKKGLNMSVLFWWYKGDPYNVGGFITILDDCVVLFKQNIRHHHSTLHMLLSTNFCLFLFCKMPQNGGCQIHQEYGMCSGGFLFDGQDSEHLSSTWESLNWLTIRSLMQMCRKVIDTVLINVRFKQALKWFGFITVYISSVVVQIY